MPCVPLIEQDTGKHVGWMCGENLDVEDLRKWICSVPNCGRWADFLCDYPLGDGKTCDAPLCAKHAIQQGAEWEDIHFCRAHALMAAGQVKTEASPVTSSRGQ